MKSLFFLSIFATVMVSCQFTETMVLNDDGSGSMSVSMDLSEVLKNDFGTEKDPNNIKLDTVIFMKKILEEKRDSISKLSKDEQEQLKNLENFNINLVMDSEEEKMIFRLFTDFTSLDQANNIFNKLNKSTSMTNALDKQIEKKEKEPQKEVIGTKYQYKKLKFVRDAYIIDPKEHQAQVDSLKQTEDFLKEMTYTLNYTFPRKIKSISNPKAQINKDQKSLILEVGFTDYFKNPNILDLEVVLEK